LFSIALWRLHEEEFYPEIRAKQRVTKEKFLCWRK